MGTQKLLFQEYSVRTRGWFDRAWCNLKGVNQRPSVLQFYFYLLMTMAGSESKEEDIGIIGMEVYFPKYYVDQKELGKVLKSLQIIYLH